MDIQPTGPDFEDPFHPPVIVQPVTAAATPFRRVEIYGREVGVAYCAEDVVEFLRRAGVPDADLDDEELVGWHGGGRDVWV
ncbi:hypothetical protein [Streptacidiphilus sp. EB129]|uniref:hypothetical protein n=1 Tax=Streptacidiphilus sp. EB129 TaxID=3156262 RepID=UPI003512813A